jgi:S-adenosylmethionine decarboxylase
VDTLGRHLIAEFYGCESVLINTVADIRQMMLEAAEVVGATVVGESFHHFSPIGVSGTVVIAESHLSVHTWPEHGYVAVDIFTCGGLDPRPGFEFLKKKLGASSSRVQEIVRGMPEDIPKDYCLESKDVLIVSQIQEIPSGLFPTSASVPGNLSTKKENVNHTLLSIVEIPLKQMFVGTYLVSSIPFEIGEWTKNEVI